MGWLGVIWKRILFKQKSVSEIWFPAYCNLDIPAQKFHYGFLILWRYFRPEFQISLDLWRNFVGCKGSATIELLWMVYPIDRWFWIFCCPCWKCFLMVLTLNCLWALGRIDCKSLVFSTAVYLNDLNWSGHVMIIILWIQCPIYGTDITVEPDYKGLKNSVN